MLPHQRCSSLTTFFTEKGLEQHYSHRAIHRCEQNENEINIGESVRGIDKTLRRTFERGNYLQLDVKKLQTSYLNHLYDQY